jgi:hypothetical protein
MSLEQIVERMRNHPWYLDSGAGKLARRWKCNREDIYKAKAIVRGNKIIEEKKVPKILLLDIETAPLRAHVWRLWKQDIYIDQIISEWFMISWSAKWLYDDKIMSDVLTPEEILKEKDKRIVTSIWYLLNQADIVITHNGVRFDIPKIQTRFLYHGLPPASFYQQIDTFQVAKKEFGFSSNKMDFIARFLGLDVKIKTDFTLWVECLEGDQEALDYMVKYNEHDVEILEEVYLKLRPYIKNHPNYNLYIDSETPVCPHCGGSHLSHVGYYYYTPTGKYKDYRCDDCGALSRERKTILQNRKNILISNGR